MNIRYLKQEEIGAVSEIIGKNWTQEDAQASRPELEAMFTQKVMPPTYLVAESDNEIRGVAGYVQSWMDYHAYHIFWVNVDPEHQRRGIGTSLVQKAIYEIKKQEGENRAKIILLTAKDTEFYEKIFGFKVYYPFKNGVAVMGLGLED